MRSPLLDEGLRLANLRANELAAHRSTEPVKVLLAGLLWKRQWCPNHGSPGIWA
jgi:hypothetical protein